MEIGLRFFTMMHRFRRLRIPERLGMLPRSEHMVLEMLLEHETENGQDAALSAICIARRMKVTAPAISRTLRHLREHGLVDTEPDPRDRRGTCIRLTQSGRQSLASDKEQINALMRRAMARLEPGELDRFFLTFDRICDSIALELDQAQK
ncbi:MAG: MarR family transcriptional regulator [Butyricicoccus sp.]|nr:MarR family transcriptional regulator [Butyricicoccus sp.]